MSDVEREYVVYANHREIIEQALLAYRAEHHELRCWMREVSNGKPCVCGLTQRHEAIDAALLAIRQGVI